MNAVLLEDRNKCVMSGPVGTALDLVSSARLVFVGGIAASGKTTMCRAVKCAVGAQMEHVHVGAIACDIGTRHG